MEEKEYTSDGEKRKMSKEQLAQLSSDLFEQAFDANSFWCILKQFKKNTKKYKNEMMCSVAFYNVIFQSLSTSFTLLLAKLFDNDSHSLSLNILLNGMREITLDDLEPEVRKRYKAQGEKLIYSGHLANDGIRVSEESTEQSVSIKYLPLDECVKAYQKQMREFRKEGIIDNLSNRRNKIYAHNDKESNFDFESVNNKFPLTDRDAERLLNFALECTQFVKSIITGITIAPEYVNIDDWEKTLKLVKSARKRKKKLINIELLKRKLYGDE